MDEDYDVIALGTGLKECILSGLLSSVASQKVLHMDRNSYYGGESASLNLEQLYKRFRGDEKPPESLGRSRDYCVDLCPKFLMACGTLVKLLLTTKVTAYLEFQSIAGSFCYKDEKGSLGKIHKLPSTPNEALKSGMLSIFQKGRFHQFVAWVDQYDKADPKTHKGCDLTKMTNSQLFKFWKLEESTQRFVGHALALYIDDGYLDMVSEELVERVKLYAYSVFRYGNSPYIYPKWGLGGLPEGFSRRCAVHGGVYMLNVEEKPDFVEKINYDEEGRVCGVTSEGKTAKCNKIVADPSYFIGTDKVKKTGQIARCICILSHPVPRTNDSDSCQIIIPAGTVPGKKSDIYVCMVSHVHNIAAPGKYVAVMSTNVETSNPEGELKTAFDLIGAVDEKFFWVSDVYVPCNDPTKDGCYITESYDATTHFLTVAQEVLKVYKDMTGNDVDLNISADPDQLEP